MGICAVAEVHLRLACKCLVLTRAWVARRVRWLRVLLAILMMLMLLSYRAPIAPSSCVLLACLLVLLVLLVFTYRRPHVVAAASA